MYNKKKGKIMISLKKLFTSLFILGFIAFPLSLNAQNQNKDNNSDKNKTEQTQTMDQTKMGDNNEYSTDQLDQKLSTMEESGSGLEREFETIAEKNVNQISQKLNLNDDGKENVKKAIVDYLGSRWQKRIELAKEKNDSEKAKESSADLAYLRVDLSEQIKDELPDAQKWDNNSAVSFWTSLDSDIFSLQMEKTGMATEISNDQKQ